MPSRRVFLTKAAVAAAAITTSIAAANPSRAAQPSPAPLPSPAPHPTASPGPSALALALAKSLQKDLPRAHLSDSMTQKIAGDINDNFAINKTFRNKKKRQLPPPDFIFSAAETEPA